MRWEWGGEGGGGKGDWGRGLGDDGGREGGKCRLMVGREGVGV